MKNKNRAKSTLKYIFLLIMLPWLAYPSYAQQQKDVYVDEEGVMRWGESKKEVKGFGVNYTVPFAHAYRMAKNQGIDLEQAIDTDVYNFARLGLDLYRVHVWDTEISDSAGNLLENEHLRLFDYAVKKMKERGMKFIITPIAYWGNGWPERDEDTPGFSAKYGKGPSLTNPEAIKAQEKYLYQFLNHVNPYTGLAYKEDPDVIAFEVSNEPHHGGTVEAVTEFINKMVHSMRESGTKKPIFYNMSHSTHLAKAYMDADIQGGTFQWYPTNLVAEHELEGNFLPNVEKYTFPFADSSRFAKMAKIVYEFDPADIGASYMYPAMARSFREAGMQLGAQFAYDAAYMAPFNTNYGTHYMNLPYAPQKALSLKIASEVFHEMPMNKSYGSYPENTTFGDFRISYEEDLAEMVSEKKFFYTNHTQSNPPAIKKLEEIAGYGNSPLVEYEGTGAYFLDRLEKGVWRLEIMPDAMWVSDPFARISPKNTVSVVQWNERTMDISLPDLGGDFTITPLNEGNSYSPQASNGSFSIQPGAYLLQKKGAKTKWKGDSQWKNIRLNEFEAPAGNVNKTFVLHESPGEVTAGKAVELSVKIIAPEAPEEVELHIWRRALKMEKTGAFTYTTTIPDSLVNSGFLQYYISVKEEENTITYPSGKQTYPKDWDFIEEDAYKLRIVEEEHPIYLFNASSDSEELMRNWVRGTGMKPAGAPGEGVFAMELEKIPVVDPVSNAGKEIRDYSMRYYFGDKVAGRQGDLRTKKEIILHGQSLNGQKMPIQLALVMENGAAHGGIIMVGPEEGDYAISLDELEKVKLVSLPRPYPDFLPYFFENLSASQLELEKVESLQFSVGPGLSVDDLNEPYPIQIKSVRLQ